MIALASLALLQSATAVLPIPDMESARAQVEAKDAALFWAAFEGCNAAAIEELITPDFRMLHDLGGLAIKDGATFVADMERQCASRAPGGENAGYQNRRLLVPGTRTVTPLGDWGVLERGYHTFHEWRGEQTGWVQTGGARYIHVWQWQAHEGEFRLAESISVDHGAAVNYPPASASVER
ncbi:hypothetical protein BPTFM16_02449 [Altererythrobacter insulae]|nr:hypothetical protein BPTFM16_02449 [Altererythrobacter insulae]